MKVAVVGAGVAGLAAAHTLRKAASVHHVTLFEASQWLGGHAHTVDVTLPGSNLGQPFGVDTGFLVFNERTYPRLIRLFTELGVATAKSDMSFSVQARQRPRGAPDGPPTLLEWSGSNLNTVFAQRSNLLRPRFWNMLRDLLRFNRLATSLAMDGSALQMQSSLGEFLREHRFSREFADWYLLPMVACIWSCPASQMLQYPVASLIQFCHNHGLLQITGRPQWWTVTGGSRHYVEKIAAGLLDVRLGTPVRRILRHGQSRAGGITIATDHGSGVFDKVVIATHAGQALEMLAEPTTLEARTLGAIRHQPNKAVLHLDSSVLPSRRSAWAAWNHEFVAGAGRDDNAQVCLHYLINKLQPLPTRQPVLVSLNPISPIAPDKVLGEFNYAHPVFDRAAVKAQRHMPWLQGQQHSYFCGAWQGYGFHEDGYTSGLQAAQCLLDQANTDGANP